MKRIYPAYTYGPGPRTGCWWDVTCDIPRGPVLHGDQRGEVAIIGAGFTGLRAALHLAEAGVDVAVLESETVGWGASGRNGGFCCLGGAIAGDAALDKAFGRSERLAYRAVEKAAIAEVAALLDRFAIDADRHSQGETQLAHRAKDMADLEVRQREIAENYGVNAALHTQDDLSRMGLEGGFFGGLTVPLGFGLNPRKYLAALYRAALAAGAKIYEHSPVSSLHRTPGKFRLVSGQGRIVAAQVLVATNGYTPENLTSSLRNRFMPVQSSVLVTRPLTPAEKERQNWTSDQMCYDTRHLLHYFRLMPDGRFLFGMRGGLLGGAAAETRARRRLVRDFRDMFPAWRHVEVTHSWSGLVALARRGLPFVGPLEAESGLFAALCYHGNGVAMGSFSGKLAAQLILGERPENYPKAMQGPLTSFPLGPARRLLLPPAYAAFGLLDRSSRPDRAAR